MDLPQEWPAKSCSDRGEVSAWLRRTTTYGQGAQQQSYQQNRRTDAKRLADHRSRSYLTLLPNHHGSIILRRPDQDATIHPITLHPKKKCEQEDRQQVALAHAPVQ